VDLATAGAGEQLQRVQGERAAVRGWHVRQHVEDGERPARTEGVCEPAEQAAVAGFVEEVAEVADEHEVNTAAEMLGTDRFSRTTTTALAP
jgi:hypothetical protein